MAKTEDIVDTMSALSEVFLTTHVVTKLQPAGVTVRVGSVIDFEVSESRLKTVVPPANAFSTTVGVNVEHVLEKATVNVCGCTLSPLLS